MKRDTKNVCFLDRGEGLAEAARTGVSLHCHTLHSKELLDFVPYYAERIPVASYFWQREMRRHLKRDGRLPDFTTGHWTPPLTGTEVFGMESENMAKLGLEAIVSITDHDSINANLELRNDIAGEAAPISMEWTVPFENAFFHIGVHNLPREQAAAITAELLAYTYAKGWPDNDRLHEIFEMLNDLPDVLVVLNHPIWDIEMIGQQEHERLLARFVAEHARWIHTLEINGFRSWAENELVIDLAEQLGLPIVSGGDRHCCQSNTMINVTDSRSFAEFAGEIRNDRFSRIVVMPEYKDPLPVRQLRSIAQILGNYAHFPEGRKLWSDRVFLDHNDGNGVRTLTEHWNGRRPKWTYAAFFALKVLTHPAVRPLITLTVGDNDIGRDEKRQANTVFPIGNSPISAQR